MNCSGIEERRCLPPLLGHRGLLIDGRALYSSIAILELVVLVASIIPEWNEKLEPILNALNNYIYWQYGTGYCVPDPRHILVFISLLCLSADQSTVFIRHLIMYGSSQWVIGLIVTSHGDICQSGSPILVLRDHMNENIFFTIVIVNRLHHLSAECFRGIPTCTNSTFHSPSFHALTSRPWPDVKAIVDSAHLQVRFYSDYDDMKTLLARNDLWDGNV